jgi:CHAD domain-containing protein
VTQGGDAGPKVPHEREAKVSVWPGFELPDLRSKIAWIDAGEAEEQLLDARFVDAPDLRLLRMGITFRHRTGEGTPEGRWTLKLPVPSEGLALDRLEMEEDGPPGPPPAHMVAVVRGVLRGASLVEVAHLQTRRTAVPLQDPASRPLGMLSDDVVSALSGDHVGLRFREIEVEAVDGAPDSVIEVVVGALRAAGAGEPDHVPKLAKALGPRALAAADPDVPDAGKDAAAAAVFQAAVARSVRRLLEHDPIVRLDAGEEGVHQARVATRRLRSDLRTFRSLLDQEAVASLREDLTWLGELLGAVRDADVLTARLTEAADGLDDPDDQEAARGLVARAVDERGPKLAALLEAMDGQRYLALTEAIVNLALRPPLLAEAAEPARTVLRELAGGPWDHLGRNIGKLDDEPTDEELHRVRILAKRARYAAETASSVLPGAARHASAIADLQGVLGDHQDAVVAQRWLRDAVSAGVTGPQAFAAGLLVRAEQDLARRERDRWPKAWRDANRKKLTAWLHE